jgi:5'-methylthioadenosine phosphorylase
MGKSVVGVIGGSGLYQMEGLKKIREVEIKTPFGRPSEKFIKGNLGETELAFLARHGKAIGGYRRRSTFAPISLP